MELNYKNLYYNAKEKKWDDESIWIIRDMLEVWDCEHRIIICHPNVIFLPKPITKEGEAFEELSWESLSEDFKLDNSNSFVSFIPDANDSWKYIHRRFRHELFENKNSANKPRYLVVVEQDREGGNLVRGILRATKDDIKVAFNPMYELYKPKGIFDKWLRIDDSKFISLREFVEQNRSKIPVIKPHE